MTILFKAKTNDAYYIKILIELLQNNIKIGCFVIDKNGIHLNMYNSSETIAISLTLHADKFNIYTCKFKKPKVIGINLDHFHKMIKSIKKNDSIVFTLTNTNENELHAKIIPKDTSCRTQEITLIISEIQLYDLILPKDYDKHNIIKSNEFQSTCKELSNIDSNIVLFSKKHYIKFYSNRGTHKKGAIFGEIDEDDDEDDDTDEYKQTYSSEFLLKICKISGLYKNLQVFIEEDNPLLIKSQIGNIGDISVYIKSNELIQKEKDSTRT